MIRGRFAQTWLVDYIVAFTVFILIVVVVVNALMQIGTEDEYTSLTDEARLLGEVLLSEGVPAHWNNVSIIRPGLLNDSRRIDHEKLLLFEELDPDRVRTLLGMRFDYDISLLYLNGSRVPVCYACNSSSESDDSLAVVNRLAVYNGSVVVMRVEVFS